jgi:uncharacterized surface protein with fasciclin (FAS1) repeats
MSSKTDLSSKSNKELIQLLKNEGFYKSIPKSKDLKIELLKNLQKKKSLDELLDDKDNNNKTLIVSNVESPSSKLDSDIIGLIDNLVDKKGKYEIIAEDKDEKISCYNDTDISICASPEKIDSFINSVNKKNLTDFYISEDEKNKPIKDIVNNLDDLSDLYSELDKLLESNNKPIKIDKKETNETVKNILKENFSSININDLLGDLDDLLNSDTFNKKILPEIEVNISHIDEKGNLDNSIFVSKDEYKNELLSNIIETDDDKDKELIKLSMLKTMVSVKDYEKKELKEVCDKNKIFTNTSLQNILKNDSINNFKGYTNELLSEILSNEFFVPNILISNTLDFKKDLLSSIINNNTINLLDKNNFDDDDYNKNIIFVLYNVNIGIYISPELYNEIINIKNINDNFKVIKINNKIVFGNNKIIDELLLLVTTKKLGNIEKTSFKKVIIETKDISNLITLLLDEKVEKFINLLTVDTEYGKINKLLNNDESYTIFIPIDDAFNNLKDKKLKPWLYYDKDFKKQVLNQHIIKGNYKNINLIPNDYSTIELKTINNEKIVVKKNKDNYIVLDKNAKILKSDIIFTPNITIHLIDNILIPEEFKNKKEKEIEKGVSEKVLKDMKENESILSLLDNLPKEPSKIPKIPVDIKNITEISSKSGITYTEQILKTKQNKDLRDIIESFGIKQNLPVNKAKMIKLILDYQKSTCNIDTTCESENEVCNVHYSTVNGICSNLSDIDLNTFYFIKHKNKVFVAGKISLNNFMKENKISETIIPIRKYPKLIPALITESTAEELKDDKVVEISKNELISIFAKEQELNKLTDTGLASLNIIPISNSIKDENDIEKIISESQTKFIDLDPTKINEKSKQQIARCLGLLP